MATTARTRAITRDQLHQLVDQLPEDSLVPVARYLRRHTRPLVDLDAALAAAPLDDEPFTDEDQAALEEARADFVAGRFVTDAQLRRELGL